MAGIGKVTVIGGGSIARFKPSGLDVAAGIVRKTAFERLDRRQRP